MKIIDKPTIQKVIAATPAEQQIAFIEAAFTSLSDGTASVPPVGHLVFQEPPGDLHIKYGYIQGDPYYVIKVASSFYNNSDLGLSNNNGMMLAYDANTGTPLALLQDEGYLTDLRTAIAGAVAAKHLGPSDVKCIGIIGTGVQARMQLQSLAQITQCRKVVVWGRDSAKSSTFKDEMEADGFSVYIASTTSELASHCNLIVTTTSSTSPLLSLADIQPGTHITAMGSDMPGKQELDSAILQVAEIVACDSVSQCLTQGEAAFAVERGEDHGAGFTTIGDIIISPINRSDNAITVADLTGIATQDIKITNLVLNQFL